jgi:hypothetical protein
MFLGYTTSPGGKFHGEYVAAPIDDILSGKGKIRTIRTRDIRFPDEINFPIKAVLNLRRAVQHLKDMPEFSVGQLEKLTIEFGMTVDPTEDEEISFIPEPVEEVELTERSRSSKPSKATDVFALNGAAEVEGEYPEEPESTLEAEAAPEGVQASTGSEPISTTSFGVPKKLYIRRNVELRELGY